MLLHLINDLVLAKQRVLLYRKGEENIRNYSHFSIFVSGNDI